MCGTVALITPTELAPIQEKTGPTRCEAGRVFLRRLYSLLYPFLSAAVPKP